MDGMREEVASGNDRLDERSSLSARGRGYAAMCEPSIGKSHGFVSF